MTIAALAAKLATGNYSLATLSPEEVALLATTLRPLAGTGFDAEQLGLMADFYLLAPGEAAIDALNQGRTFRLAKLQTVSGEWVTTADALTDSRDGETFGHARAEISSWLIVQRGPDEFPVVEV